MEADETKSSTWAGVRWVDGPGSEFGGIGSVGGGSEAVCRVATWVSPIVSLAFQLDSPSLVAAASGSRHYRPSVIECS